MEGMDDGLRAGKLRPLARSRLVTAQAPRSTPAARGEEVFLSPGAQTKETCHDSRQAPGRRPGPATVPYARDPVPAHERRLADRHMHGFHHAVGRRTRPSGAAREDRISGSPCVIPGTCLRFMPLRVSGTGCSRRRGGRSAPACARHGRHRPDRKPVCRDDRRHVDIARPGTVTPTAPYGILRPRA